MLVLVVGAGGAGPRAGRPRRHAAQRACRSCTSSTASAPRTRSNKIEPLDDDDLRALIDDELVAAHRERGALARTARCCAARAQNPDVFFQAREAATRSTRRVPGDRAARRWTRFAERTGRRYRLFDYVGAPDAERVDRADGLRRRVRPRRRSSALAATRARGSAWSRCGCSGPFAADGLRRRAARRRVRAIAVLDRTKEPGALGEPLYQDVVTALARGEPATGRAGMPRVIGGRYGLSSKEFTPAMAKAVFDELATRRAANALHGRHRRRRHRTLASTSTRLRDRAATTSSAPSSTGWAATARSARTRTRSRSSARTPTCTRRATSSTTRRSRVR